MARKKTQLAAKRKPMTVNSSNKSDNTLRNENVLSIINFLITVTCGLILYVTWISYHEPHLDEYIRLIDEIYPFLIGIAVSNSIITYLMSQCVLQDDKRVVVKQIRLFVRIRSILAILLLGISAYPAVQLSGISQLLADFLTTITTQITSTINYYLVVFFNWIISGIGTGYCFLSLTGMKKI